MKPFTIGYEQWEKLVSELTGVSYAPHADDSYELPMAGKVFPTPLFGLKRLPYETGSNDCDDRSKIGYCELHAKHKRMPIALVRGDVRGQGRHEFLVVGCILYGSPAAVFCHRLENRFEWISRTDVTKITEVF